MSQNPDIVEMKKQEAPAAAPDISPVTNAPQEENKVPKWVPGPLKNVWGDSVRWIARARTASILATPAIIVNNTSNVLGGMHVLTEMLMFKSGFKENKLIDNPSNPINWVWEPAQKIYKDIVTRGAARDYSFTQLFRGNIGKNFHKYVTDTYSATHRELDRQVATNRALAAAGKATKSLSLGNPWQTRTTGTGLVIWLLSVFIPERKESDEEIERMARMRTLHPFQYIGTRLKQAVWFPEWPTHKREMLGLGYLGIGTWSGLGSWRNRGDLNAEIKKDAELIQRGLKQRYKFNAGYFATAIVSFLCGLPLLFALDERKAYSSYGALSLLRIPALPPSLWSKIKDRESGWQFYTTGKLLFQVEDFLFSLIGGATKKVNPDGSVEIVDHEKLKKQAIAKAKQEKVARRQIDSGHEKFLADSTELQELVDSPTSTITQASAPERAMPERAAQIGKHGEMTANDPSMMVAANSR